MIVECIGWIVEELVQKVRLVHVEKWGVAGRYKVGSEVERLIVEPIICKGVHVRRVSGENCQSHKKKEVCGCAGVQLEQLVGPGWPDRDVQPKGISSSPGISDAASGKRRGKRS